MWRILYLAVLAVGASANVINEKIPGELQITSEVIFNGTADEDAKIFSVNLANGGNFKTADLALHFSVRMPGIKIVKNTRFNRKWGSKRISYDNPFERGKYYEIRIVLEKSEYHIYVNGTSMFTFPYRKNFPYDAIDHAIIKGDVNHFKVVYKNLKHDPLKAPPTTTTATTTTKKPTTTSTTTTTTKPTTTSTTTTTTKPTTTTTTTTTTKPTTTTTTTTTTKPTTTTTTTTTTKPTTTTTSTTLPPPPKKNEEFFKKLIMTKDKKWAIIQRRSSADVDFYKGWSDYENGFGNATGNFWYGLNATHCLCNKQKPCKLRVELCVQDKKVYAEYSSFYIDGADDKYKLHVSGYHGNACNSLAYHNHMMFSTFDSHTKGCNCAKRRHGAWWYGSCKRVNLNGKWGAQDHTGLQWTKRGRIASDGYSRMMIKQK